MSWDDLNTAHYDWPSVAAVRDYRAAMRERIDQFIQTMPLELPIRWNSPAWIILMGIEHERIHLETSSVIMRQMPLDELRHGADLSAEERRLWGSCPAHGTPPAMRVTIAACGYVRSMNSSRYRMADFFFASSTLMPMPTFAVSRPLGNTQR
jgi:hypothetical protein